MSHQQTSPLPMDEIRQLLVRNAQLETELRLVKDQLTQANSANQYLLTRLSSSEQTTTAQSQARLEAQYLNTLAENEKLRSMLLTRPSRPRRTSSIAVNAASSRGSITSSAESLLDGPEADWQEVAECCYNPSGEEDVETTDIANGVDTAKDSTIEVEHDPQAKQDDLIDTSTPFFQIEEDPAPEVRRWLPLSYHESIREHKKMMGLATFIEDDTEDERYARWEDLSRNFRGRPVEQYEEYWQTTILPKYQKIQQQKAFSMAGGMVGRPSVEKPEKLQNETQAPSDLLMDTLETAPHSDEASPNESNASHAVDHRTTITDSPATVEDGVEKGKLVETTQEANIEHPSPKAALHGHDHIRRIEEAAEEINMVSVERRDSVLNTSFASADSAMTVQADSGFELIDADAFMRRTTQACDEQEELPRQGLEHSMHADPDFLPPVRVVESQAAPSMSHSAENVSEDCTEDEGPHRTISQATATLHATSEPPRASRALLNRGADRNSFGERRPFHARDHGPQNLAELWRKPVGNDPEAYRTVLIGGIPKGVSRLQVMAAVRGGRIVTVVFAKTHGFKFANAPPMTTNTAMITFVKNKSARSFVKYCEHHPLNFVVEGAEPAGQVTVELVHTAYLPVHPKMLADIRENNLSRVLFMHGSEMPSPDELFYDIHNLPEGATWSKPGSWPLRWGFDHDNFLCFEYASISDAKAACNRVRAVTRGLDVGCGFLRDPCEEGFPKFERAEEGGEDDEVGELNADEDAGEGQSEEDALMEY